MPDFRLPLGGDVNQAFRLFTSMFSMFGSQVGLININMGRSSAPEVEQEVLENVGSYGRQLGRIGDAVAVLLAHLPPDAKLSPEERKAINALTVMLDDIADIKRSHDRAAFRPDETAAGRVQPQGG